MSTLTTATDAQRQKEASAIRHNMSRDDWRPQITLRGPISRVVQNVVFPDGNKPVLTRHSGRNWRVDHREHLGRFSTPEQAARAARAEALRQWTATEQENER